MNKTQFWILNSLAALLTLFVVTNITLNLLSRSTSSKIQKIEAKLSNFQNIQAATKALVTKVAQNSKDDSQLRDLLAKYNLKVTFDEKQMNNGGVQ